MCISVCACVQTREEAARIPKYVAVVQDADRLVGDALPACLCVCVSFEGLHWAFRVVCSWCTRALFGSCVFVVLCVCLC